MSNEQKQENIIVPPNPPQIIFQVLVNEKGQLTIQTPIKEKKEILSFLGDMIKVVANSPDSNIIIPGKAV